MTKYRKSYKSFCHGLLCKRKYRIYKCLICKVWLCRVCLVKYKNKNYCPDCFTNIKLSEFNKDFQKKSKEFRDWIDKNW